MSRRSHNGEAHERRLSKYRVTDDDLFEYVLRVAILHHLLQPRPVEVQEQQQRQRIQAEREREHHSRLSALSNFSIGDLFRESGSKSVKFPEKLVKVLEQKLENIALGRDPAYHDQFTRRTMAKFYNQFDVDNLRRQMKESRKIEELILRFATQATTVLKKEPTLAGDAWKAEVNNQIAQFIKILRECLRTISSTSPELLARLDTYTAKLAPTLAAQTSVYSSASGGDSGYDSGSTASNRDNRDSMTAILAAPSSNVTDMHMVSTVARLFKIQNGPMQQEVDKMRGTTVTEKAALLDLKTCLKNIAAGAEFPGSKDDFDTEAAWSAWRHRETTELQQLMLDIIAINPELARHQDASFAPSSSTNPQGIPHLRTNNLSGGARPTSHYSLAESPVSRRGNSIGSRQSLFMGGSMNDYDDAASFDLSPYADPDAASLHSTTNSNYTFTFIPPAPKRYYKRLLELCLISDLELMLSPEVDDNEQVSLGILSEGNLELVRTCARQWRVGREYESACFLEMVKGFYERGDVPMECVPEALGGVGRVINGAEGSGEGGIGVHMWMKEDADYLATTYASLFNIFLSSLYHTLDTLPALKPSAISSFLDVLEHIRSSPLLSRFDIDVEARLLDVQERVRQVANGWYEGVMAEKLKAPGVNRAMPLLLMGDEIEKAAKGLDRRFPEPLLGKLDLTSLFVEVAVPRLFTDIQASQKRLFESSMNGPTPDVPIQDIFALYRRSKVLMSMYKAFVPDGTFMFQISGFFEPYVRQWLINTDDKTKHWVEAAIAHDKFEAEGAEGHSSSIVDLFDSLRSPIGFLQELEWEDEYQEAKFFTSLAKTISKAVETYCRSVETLFLSEMFPRPTDYLQPQKSSAWLEKARQLALVSDNKRIIEPFNFQPQSCVKLNNVEAARRLLDNMYSQIQADKVAEVVRTAVGPPVPEKDGEKKENKFLFSVKLVVAQGLVPLDGSPNAKLDTFVTLSNEEGTRLAKTRTIYESLDPRWDETFDLSVEKPLWLMVCIRDRSLVGKHDIIGRAYLCLDPRRFADFLSHELWMDLDTAGRILVRISMEGEKDDIQFYFGRAFRSLKRAESDMVRIFIDKMAPFIQQCLSRGVIKTLLKSREQGMDYNKALSALYRTALGNASSEPQIPLPPSEKPRVRPEELTDVEVEQAIAPLFDYLDSNMQTLNTYLSDVAKEMVMTRVWKEILGTIEGLLIPPLSDVESEMKPLSEKEVDIVFRWLKFLRDYFFANGEGPVPLETLQNQKYRDIFSIRLYYDWHTDALMEECVRMMQLSLKSTPTIKKRVKSVYQQRNLGTIRERKKEKKQEADATSEEVILRILRMRPGTSEFIMQQLETKRVQEQAAREAEARKLKRQQQALSQQRDALPPVPPLPGHA